MKVVNRALVREQNENDVDDSCFDTSECYRMLDVLKSRKICALDLGQFIIDLKLQRHPKTNFLNDISSDQAHMYYLATGNHKCSVTKQSGWFQPNITSNGDIVSVGFWSAVLGWHWLSNLALIGQIILFWIPLRWNDGNGSSRIQFGYKHHAGDYRLFKQCLYHAPWIIRKLVLKTTLKKMTREYWKPEPNAAWLISIDDKFIDTL